MSEVWDIFVKSKSSDGNVVAKCGKCEVILKVSDGSTTTLRRHLKTAHDMDLDIKTSSSSATKSKKVKEDTAQPTPHSFIKSKGTLDKKSKKYERITYDIAKTIFLDLQPLSVVEDNGFVGLFRKLLMDAISFLAERNSLTIFCQPYTLTLPR